MKDYIKKTKVKAMPWTGAIEEMLLLMESYKDYSFTPKPDGSIEVLSTTEDKAAPKLCEKGQWIIEHKGVLHIVTAEDISNDYYAERQTSKKEEKKTEKKDDAPTRKRRTKSEIEAERAATNEENAEVVEDDGKDLDPEAVMVDDQSEGEKEF